MRKIISAFAVAVLIFAFSSCRSNGESTDTVASTDTTGNAAESETQKVAQDTTNEQNGTEEITDTGVVTDTSTVTDGDTAAESVTDAVVDETQPAGHTHLFGEWKTVENATCEKTGLSRRSCACGASEEKELSKANHTPVVDKGTPATCTEDGASDGSHCSVCGKVIKAQTKISAKGHKGGTWVTDKEACDEHDGARHQNCANCGAKLKDEAIIVSHGLEFKYSSDYCTLIGIGTCTDTVITVPKTSHGVKVKKIDDKAFKDANKITQVFLPDTITDIGDKAFYGCSSLKSIGCSSLERITMPSGLEWLGYSAFEGCSALESISIPSLETINDSCFSGCGKLKSVTLQKVKTIGEYAFADCSSLSSIRFPSTLQKLNFACLLNCYNLNTIEYSGNAELFRRSVTVVQGWNDGAGTGAITCLAGGEDIYL